ncbi:tryptophan synthase beta chain [Lentilactobacillus kosonis]|uniref:Tryptophan synthase beta chain n=1 Tax=Lentilactobacillus kosonis TaxID=2810561 RepID=A0A401FJJ4_9LACO|nr:tryptophan synthase beta chain [Lentilactobacillus kosonis]
MQEIKQTKPGIYGQKFGGQYIPETLMTELEKSMMNLPPKNDDLFQQELHDLLVNYANRPSLLYYAKI